MKHELSDSVLSQFRRQAELWDVCLGDEELDALAIYTEALCSYDRANVVGTREFERAWLAHVLDSLSCLAYGPLEASKSLVDVGTGGGMPGIPLHIVVRFDQLCLLESTGKKASFLRYVREHLGLSGVEIANSRAEELGKKAGYRGGFEVATVRAVAALDVVVEFCLPFLEVGGVMIAMKGSLGDKERRAGERAARTLGGELDKVMTVPILPELEQKARSLVVVKKVRQTPELYPRDPGTPKRKPLGSIR